MVTLNPYLSFSGNAEEAFNFYKYSEVKNNKVKTSPPDPSPERFGNNQF